MKLKQIELTGFKSFADRTVMNLVPGVTSIVGPNGCGKSNILDAMRWVLGEQRAKELRGSQMQDIIFNGSENRHAQGMAEVSITFDNADSSLPVDFTEVQVSRRVYRSGESEYLMNKAPCRLKDITELFMDTGVGTAAYSMVSQGKMDLILSSKPEDRRFVFEEAAGIIKYKKRKRIAMRRLDSAEQNLLRLTDIIAEVERQMRSLKRQVNKAIRYRELSEQLRDIEIRAAWLQHVRISETIGKLREQFATAQDRFETVSARVTKLEARREEVGLNQLEVDRVLLTRREGVHEIDSEMERIERTVALLRQRIDFCRGEQSRAVREQEEYERRASAIAAELVKTDERLDAVRKETDSSREAVVSKTQEHDAGSQSVSEAEAAVEALRGQAAQRMEHRTKTLTELERLGARVSNIDGQLEAIYQRQSGFSVRREALLTQLEETRSEESEKQGALEEAERQRASANETLTGIIESLRGVDGEWQGLREKKSSVEARLRSLRELRDNYEGFAVGVRAVMRAATEGVDGLAGMIGPAGDLLSSDKEYERAIEAALGGNINNVIVEDADAAKAAVGFLKQHRAGRVTFLPLDMIRGRRREEKGLEGEVGVVGPVMDFVRFEDRLRPAVEYLFEGTIIVETLDDAVRLARKRSSIPRLVTLDGEVVSPAGAVTGGRTRHESRGLLGRSAEITELEEQVAATDADLARLATERESLGGRLDQENERIKALGEQQAALRNTLSQLGVAIARFTTEMDNLAQSAEGLDKERDALTASREQFESERSEAVARADTLESDDQAFQQALGEAQAAASAARHALSVCASELADLRVQQAALNQRLEEAQRDKERGEFQRQEALAEMERRKALLSGSTESETTLEEEVKDNLERAKALSESKEQAHAKVVEADNQRQALLEESEALDKELRDLRDQARSSQAEVHQHELDLRQNEDRLEFFQERILAEYHIALGSLKAEEVGTDEYDDETRDRLVADLRERIQSMGEVNVTAIEEYEALEKRHAFLAGQAADLHEAREQLLGVIARSDKRIREMFLTTFQEVSDYFRDYFRRLFNGGQARIYLLDEDDPLESGIEIEARPPGKKPTSISLLSGGESAMTAVALLFSIFKAKPSPFCVLDEVDAPLDDANIGRFLGLLDEFTDQSQFIVITHNKQTMAKADALYGVTMQERGVSQLVSVKFDQVDDADSAA
jgi:chromosome segregation protein